MCIGLLLDVPSLVAVLTVEQIVTAAIELLDGEGLDWLNIRALGQRLGPRRRRSTGMFKTKDELVQLAGDAIWAEIELSDLQAPDWRTAATAMAVGLHGMLTRHPWLGRAFGGHLLAGLEVPVRRSQSGALRARLDTVAATQYAAELDNTFDFGLQATLNGFETHLSSAD